VKYLASFPSPPQGVWHLGWLPIRAYAFFIIIGIVAALLIGDRRWAARGGERGVIYDIALWAVPFGLIGGRLYHVITDFKMYFGEGGAGAVAALKIWDGGLGIWGAVALGAVGAWIGCRRHHIPLPAFGDAIAPGIILAQAIGRLGNYFNQELYGRETTLPWGLKIYERHDATGAPNSLNGVSTGQVVGIVHPTFLYELLWNLFVFVLLIWVDRRFKIGHGRLFALYVAAYCVGRFWVELLRNDAATHIYGIRINSFTSMFVFIGAVVYIILAPKGREDPESLRPAAVEAEVPAEAPVREPAKELSAVAATSGVVAAVTVAGTEETEAPEVGESVAAEDESEAETATVRAGPAEADRREAGEKGETSAEAEPDVKAEPEVAEPTGEEAEEEEVVAAAGVAEPAEAPPEEIAEAAEAETEAEPAEAEEAAEAAQAGLGALEGEELAAAEEAAPEVHEAAVEAATDAEQVAEHIAEEPEAEEPQESDVVQEPVTEEAEAEQRVEEPEATERPAPDGAGGELAAGVEPDGPAEGLGAVEGEEVADAEEAAPVVHEAAVEAQAEAKQLAAEVAEEPEAESEHTPADDASAEAEEIPTEAAGSAEASETSSDDTADEQVEHDEPVTDVPAVPTGAGDVPRAVEDRGTWWRRFARRGVSR
jgi:prolipoprotein diacylglyceryl transferase